MFLHDKATYCVSECTMAIWIELLCTDTMGPCMLTEQHLPRVWTGWAQATSQPPRDCTAELDVCHQAAWVIWRQQECTCTWATTGSEPSPCRQRRQVRKNPTPEVQTYMLKQIRLSRRHRWRLTIVPWNRFRSWNCGTQHCRGSCNLCPQDAIELKKL